MKHVYVFRIQLHWTTGRKYIWLKCAVTAVVAWSQLMLSINIFTLHRGIIMKKYKFFSWKCIISTFLCNASLAVHWMQACRQHLRMMMMDFLQIILVTDSLGTSGTNKKYMFNKCVFLYHVMVQKTLNKVKLLSTALCQRVHLSWIKWQKKVSEPPSLQSVVWCVWFFSYLAYIAWSIRYTLLFSSAKTSHIGLRPLRLDTVTATPARWEPTPIVLQP